MYKRQDLDGDADLDVVSASSGDDTLAWYENTDGLGTFGPLQLVDGTAGGAHAVRSSDLDGDGDRDLFAASFADDTVAWYANTDGLGTFGAAVVVSASADGARTVAARDLDGDGDADLLSASAFDDTVGWYENAGGQGSFGPRQVLSAEAVGAWAVGADDLDGDGDADAFSISGGDDSVSWYENQDGQGAFGTELVLTAGTDGPNALATADLDGDGDLDVLSTSEFDGKLAWYENAVGPGGLGGFGAQQIIASASGAASAVRAADLDGDGDQDVVAAIVADVILWYENLDGLGNFGPPQIITLAADLPRGLFTADVDGDGDVDVLSASFADDEIAWYENLDGLGTFGSQNVITNLADQARSVFAADLDGDGDLDVISGSEADDKVAWYENLDGLGTFGAQQIISASANGVWSVFAADLDGDGDADVLSASTQNNQVAWYENADGLGGFGPVQVVATTGSSAISVFAEDLDGDGDADVLAATSSGGEVAWYENTDGLGGFGPQKVIDPFTSGARVALAADLDGDADPDVLAAAFSGDEITWYENLGCALSPADCDGDGISDCEELCDGLETDCNGNGVPDGCDVIAGVLPDCDGNGVADCIDVLTSDCNGNQLPDACDVASGFSVDCNLNGTPDECEAAPCSVQLQGQPASLSLSGGGTQVLTLTGDATHVGKFYLVLGSLSGTVPGTPVDLVVLPLNVDAYFLFTLSNPNTPPLANTLGTVTPLGFAIASFVLPPSTHPSLAGVQVEHAAVVLDLDASFIGTATVIAVSNPVPLDLVP